MFEGLAVLPEYEAPLPQRRMPARLLKLSEWLDEPPSYPAEGDELVLQAAYTPFGPHTLALLTEVAPCELSEEGRALALQTLTRYGNYVDAVAAQFTAEIAGPAPTTVRAAQDDFAAGEVAVATKTSIYAADAKVHLARDLATRLAATAVAMRAGDVTLAQASALSQAVARLDDDTARAIEAKVLRYAHRQTLTLFKASITRWASRLDRTWQRRSREMRREPRVDHQAHADGTGTLTIHAPLEDTTTISMWLTANAAATRATLGGTADARKVTALLTTALRGLADPRAPRRHGRTRVLNITIDLPSLLGLRDNPAEIPGVGPIPASAARHLAADGAVLRRLVIDPTDGHLLDYGTRTYTVPPALADYLTAVNRTSATPHSNVESPDCDMEHNIPHQRGGTTDPHNNTPVERRWHRGKTHGRFSYRKNPKTKSVTWTTPGGLTCQIDPYDYRTGP